MTGEATNYPFKNPLKQDNNNIIALLICFLFKSVQATSRICWFSLFFFASSPPCFFLKFNSLISNPYPAITLPKPPGCYTEKYGRDTADKLIFLVSTGLCVCVCVCVRVCVSSPFWITLLLFTATRWKNPLQWPPQYLKTEGFQRTQVDIVTLHCTDAQARCFCQKVLIQNKFLNSLKCSWCCNVFERSLGRERNLYISQGKRSVTFLLIFLLNTRLSKVQLVVE